MNSALIIAGAMIICFADREAGNITTTGGMKVSIRYPLLGVAILIVGVFP